MKRLFLGALSALALMTAALGAAEAAPAGKFRLCTGDPAKFYFKAGHILKRNAAGALDVEVVSQKPYGSGANLDLIIKGECDGGFVQADALMVYSSKNAQAISALERSGVLGTEQAHLLCNRSAGIGRVTDLTAKNTIAVGPAGSGSDITWQAFVLADKKRYSSVQLDRRDGVRALNAVADGSQVQCMLSVATLGTTFMKGEAQLQGKRAVLVGTDDWDMGKVAKDARGTPVYGYSNIPAGTYPAIQPSGTLYGTDAVKTITVDSLFVISTSWIQANETAADAIVSAFNRSGADFRKP